MALTTISGNLVKQSVHSYTRDPGMHLLLDALFRYLSEHKGNPDLYFQAFSDLTADTVVSDAACRVYFVYGRKQNTATDAFLMVSDHASAQDATTGCTLALVEANDDGVIAYPEGQAFGTGCTITSSTDADGTTDTTSGDGPDGFVIVGDP